MKMRTLGLLFAALFCGIEIGYAQTGEQVRLYNEGVKQYQGKNFNKAFQYFEQSAYKGYGEAYLLIGKMYLGCRGEPKYPGRVKMDQGRS